MFLVTKRLKEKEIKRQEHIYEFILTEKHHCLTLRVMQKVWDLVMGLTEPCKVKPCGKCLAAGSKGA
jgi:hypothetical protein